MSEKFKNSDNLKTVLLSLLVMMLWGSLFPMVKIGYRELSVDTSSVAEILMFAGLRFTLCGAVVSGFCMLCRKMAEKPNKKSMGAIILTGFFSIILHYSFTYTGLAFTDSSKTALIKQLGALLYVCFAFLFIKSEKFSIYKIIGAITGFLGILAINYSSEGIKFSLGDLLIMGASVCTVVANILSKTVVVKSSPFWVTGISQLFGGVVLVVAAVFMGAGLPAFNTLGCLVFAYICTASVISYTLWYYILANNALSKMFIIKFAEPLFACVFGALLLGENVLKIEYLVAFILISSGIYFGNKK